jgi:amidase
MLMTKSSKHSRLNRRRFLQAGMLSGAAAIAAPQVGQASPVSAVAGLVPPFEFDEVTIAALQEGMKSGKFTARSITGKYLARIDAIDKHGPAVNSIIELNPDALATANALDRERQAKGPRGPLHGIPVLIKDNIATHDRMQTTAGSLALVGSVPPKDAFVARKLREAGAVILGKTNLSEWANIRSSHSSSGWSGRGGQTHNPYALDRNPSGSSSGSGAAAAANLCAVAIGTETDGSIVSPANNNGIVGIKPTLGLVSRAGIIPIAHSQDTAGPMARTVTDAAILLGALRGIDPDDPATQNSGHPYIYTGEADIDHGVDGHVRVSGIALNKALLPDYTMFLDPTGLVGVRIGVVRKLFGFHDAVDKLMNDAIDEMKRQGATVVDPADITTLDQLGGLEDQVLLTELKADLNSYLAQLGDAAPVHTLQDIIEFNQQHPEQEMPYFGQDLFLKAQGKGSLYGKEYLDALDRSKSLMRAQGIDAVMNQFKLDALVAPTGAPAWVTDHIDGDHDIGGSSTPAAVAGYPHITLPMGFVYGLPVGISFFGRAWSEPTLIKFAYAFEQATRHRRPPRFLATAEVNQ